MVEFYKKGQTIYDPETKQYQKIESVKRLKIHGITRTFYDLGTGVGFQPEVRWREHHEVFAREPREEDYNL